MPLHCILCGERLVSMRLSKRVTVIIGKHEYEGLAHIDCIIRAKKGLLRR